MNNGKRWWVGVIALLAPARFACAENWVEGQHYFRIEPAPPATASSRVTVTEVFSYGCPACNGFQPYMAELRRKLPAGVTLDYVPASWSASEDWPVFQRAYLTAATLGVAQREHDAMFDAIWKTGELAIVDPKTQRLVSPLPTIADVARFYERTTGIPAAKFVATASSFAIEVGMRRADQQVKSLQAERTPTLVINGKYRIDPASAGGAGQLVNLALWLVNRELKPVAAR